MGGYAVDVLRIALSLVMFGYAAFKDVQTREVHDLVWVIFGVAAILVDAFEVYSGALDLWLLVFAVGFSAIFALAAGYVGFFGEADLLALVVVSLLNPAPPFSVFVPALFAPILFPLTVISNSVIIGASGVFVVLFYNLTSHRGEDVFFGYSGVSGLRRVMLMMTGVWRDIERVRGPPFEYPLEEVGGDGVISIRLRPDLSDDAGAAVTIARLRSMGRRRVWVAYSLPFLLVMGVGYLCSVFLGDIALYLVSFIIH